MAGSWRDDSGREQSARTVRRLTGKWIALILFRLKLLVPQGIRRLHLGGGPRRDGASQKRRYGQDTGDSRENRWARNSDALELTRQRAARYHAQYRSEHETHDEYAACGPDHQSQHSAGSGSQSHADAQLTRTLGNSIRNHAENASACQSQADDTEDAKEKRSKSWVSQFVFQEFVQGADERNRLTGIHRTYRLACAIRKC